MIDIQTVKNVSVASFINTDRFNAILADPVKEKLTEVFTKPNAKLVLDLKGINFIDSSGFGVFLSLMKTANNHYGAFKICRVSKEVMELFKLLQLHNVFEIYDDLNECVDSFS